MKRNILFISRWYPTRYDSMEGLFVQKHARAVSMYNNVSVIFVYEHHEVKKVEVCTSVYHTINEIIVYFPSDKNKILNKIFKPFRYIYAFCIGFYSLKKSGFKPDIIHANVLTRTGFIAFIYRLLTNTPYVISEHWSRLLPGQNGFKGFLRKLIAKLTVKNAACIMPVSNALLHGLEENKLFLTNCRIVENVVDECFYKQYPTNKRDKIRFLNVTCFDEKAKNLQGLLRTVRALAKERNDFELILVGDGIDFRKTYEYCKSLQFENEETVIFAGLKTSEEVAEMMQNSDLLVQFSNYESAGVVVQEALVSGLPVVSTNVGIAPDYINETNGKLVVPGDEVALLHALNEAINNVLNFDRNKIKQNTQEIFSYNTIGLKFNTVYNDFVKT